MTSMQHQLTPSKVGSRGADPASGVYLKLAFFSVALFAAPLTAYYVSRDRLFGGNPTYAGGLAALVANIVLFAYVVAAFMEDEGDGRARPGKDAQESPSQASKKDQ